MSSKEARGKPYSRIVHDFENAGFTNIELIPEYDLIFGWINGEDDVASITMGDSLAFSSGESFRPDVEIRITYHALKKYKPDWIYCLENEQTTDISCYYMEIGIFSDPIPQNRIIILSEREKRMQG